MGKALPCEHDELSFVLRTYVKTDKVAHACNHSAGQAETSPRTIDRGIVSISVSAQDGEGRPVCLGHE